jgi:septum formation protein
METIVLASASPQRRVLLDGLGVPFEVHPSGVDEDAFPEREPATRAQLLAEAKARDVEKAHPGRWIVGCDTLVVSPDGALHEKPVHADDARRMIEAQSGGLCIVHSGLTVLAPNGTAASDVSSSTVRFATLTPRDIDWWISTGLWRERSGAFQIDGPGQLMIERVEGDWTGVVGLPVFLLGRLLREAGYEWPRG